MGRLLYLTSLFMIVVLVIAPAALAQTEDLSCADFATQIGAQAVYDQDPNDPNGLDADGDGQACETKERLGETVVNAALGDWAQAVAAFGALAALIVISFQIKREGLRHSADLILQLRHRYFSDEGRETRQNTAKAIVDSPSKDTADFQSKVDSWNNPEDALLDWLTEIGLMVQRRALDLYMVESAFYNSIHKYCWADRDYIRATQEKYRTTWVELSNLHREIHFIHMSREIRYGNKVRSVPCPLQPVRRLWLKMSRRNCNYFHGVADNDIERPTPTAQQRWLADESKVHEEKSGNKALSTLLKALER